MTSPYNHDTINKITINGRPPRVMWLMNHTTLRKCELLILNTLGIDQIYVPKIFTYNEGNLSASVTYDPDKNLALSAEKLSILNKQNWYENPSKEAWEIANQYFDIAIIAFFPNQISSVCKNFNGAIILHTFGLCGKNTSYSQILQQFAHTNILTHINKCRHRFWFGMGYEHLANIEEKFLADRAVFLPVGLYTTHAANNWEGKSKQIYFVCPRINTSPYYNQVYQSFKSNFAKYNYIIAGAQPIAVNDPKVLGYVSDDIHHWNMTQSRVMFYHSREPNHIHYHPFEAIKTGMPLLFMSDGMLGKLHDKILPGQCKSIYEAQVKIKRIFNDDFKLIEEIRSSQTMLLSTVSLENCIPHWYVGLLEITNKLKDYIAAQSCNLILNQKKKVAIILPHPYLGGTLRGAILFAQALYLGSKELGDDIEIVFAYLDIPEFYNSNMFIDLPETIQKRRFCWKTLSAEEAIKFAKNNAFSLFTPSYAEYQIPDDNLQFLLDCDLWIVISDRIETPILPIKPIISVVYDYIQRYIDIMPITLEKAFLNSARCSEKVFVTTEFTRQDAIQYAGIKEENVIKLSMLTPNFSSDIHNLKLIDNNTYFIWPTNYSIHKNHINAFKALIIYYEEFDGKLHCHLTGIETHKLISTVVKNTYFNTLSTLYNNNKSLKKYLFFSEYLDNEKYKTLLYNACFLWHPVIVDNGTFCVVEAAYLNTPSLSSEYPAMQEMNEHFSLNLLWMDAQSPRDMAEKLKFMENNFLKRQSLLPSIEKLSKFKVENLAKHYWSEVKTCL